MNLIKIQNALFNTLIRLRVLLLIAVTGMTIFTGLQIPQMTIDNSNESFFRDTDETKIWLNRFRETFGNDDFMFLLIEVDEVFDAATLYRVAELVDRIETDGLYIRTTNWVGNAEKITGVEDGIAIDTLFPHQDFDELDLEEIAQTALAEPSYAGRLFTTDRKGLAVYMEFDLLPYAEGEDPRKEIAPSLYKISQDFPDLEIYAAGGPVVDYELNAETGREAPKWFAIAAMGMILALMFTTRNVAGVFVPAATVVISVVWTLGFMHLIGYKLSIVAAMVPVVLLCVGIGDTMHVVAELRQNLAEGMKRHDAIVHTLGLVSGPIFLTTFTTSAGFLAFLITGLQPLREIGVQTAMGVWIAFILTYIFAVPILAFGKQEVDVVLRRTTEKDIFARILRATADFVIRRPAFIVAVFVVSTVSSIYGITQLEIETDPIENLSESHPVRVTYAEIDKKLGGSMSMELIVDSGRPDGIKNLSFMQQMDDLQIFLRSRPEVKRTVSIIDQLKQTNRALHNNDPAYYTLPISSNQVAEYLLIYETGGGAQLDQYVSFTYEFARIQVQTDAISLTETEVLRDAIDAYLVESGSDLSVKVTGMLTLFARLGELIVNGQIESMIFALIAVSLIMMGMLRSVPLGLIAMIPNVLPVFFALGAMGLYSGKLSTIGVVIAPMVLGVAVDDTVHFFVRYKRYFDQLGSYEKAYRETMRTVGRPLMFTTIVLLGGFASFIFASFETVRMFAWAIYVAFVTALLADFLLAAVLLKWIRPLGPSVEQREAAAQQAMALEKAAEQAAAEER